MDRSIQERPTPSIGLFHAHSGAAKQNYLCRMGFPEIPELLVIDELVDGRFFPADRAIRILFEVQRSNLHGEGIEAKEFPNQGVAFPQDELDGLKGLYGSYETW